MIPSNLVRSEDNSQHDFLAQEEQQQQAQMQQEHHPISAGKGRQGNVDDTARSVSASNFDKYVGGSGPTQWTNSHQASLQELVNPEIQRLSRKVVNHKNQQQQHDRSQPTTDDYTGEQRRKITPVGDKSLTSNQGTDYL